MNFKNFGNEPPPPAVEGGGGGKLAGNLPLTRQPSIYSLTFDEFQSTIGSSGKDFGSMNMDELLKNIWSAEETQQTVGSSSGGGGQQGGGIPGPGGYLQRQGSLTLPRTLSQKTVDEVWKDLSKEYGGGKEGGGNNAAPNLQQRQQTLGEMTLEEFLVRAGVVREDAQSAGKPVGFYGCDNNSALGIGFQNVGRNSGLMGSRIPETNNQITMQSLNLPLNVNGVRSQQQQLMQQPAPQHQQQQQQLFPKETASAYTSPVPLPSSAQLGSTGIRGGIVGIADSAINGNLVQGTALQGGGMGMVGIGPGAVTIAAGSPANQLSSDGIGKSNGDTSSVSPVPYMFNGGIRGRKCSGAIEKVVERRQRRMIKNRESAARSRARKQAYTMELEAEVAKLKEENQELQKKQVFLWIWLAHVLEMMNMQQGGKRRCLRRTQTGPW
ncbi:bZIP transcription factor 46-like isoform X2 [Malania oleifera]|uniref:bZIP transcription factor 46-like isoform X2 n=1 Tax=Malania oleifera TaxID=397392 RepID=UPI0025ADEC46|nr:bZIP transcription factor 46-like isoform X2 [Malania oleifera]